MHTTYIYPSRAIYNYLLYNLFFIIIQFFHLLLSFINSFSFISYYIYPSFHIFFYENFECYIVINSHKSERRISVGHASRDDHAYWLVYHYRKPGAVPKVYTSVLCSRLAVERMWMHIALLLAFKQSYTLHYHGSMSLTEWLLCGNSEKTLFVYYKYFYYMYNWVSYFKNFRVK